MVTQLLILFTWSLLSLCICISSVPSMFTMIVTQLSTFCSNKLYFSQIVPFLPGLLFYGRFHFQLFTYSIFEASITTYWDLISYLAFIFCGFTEDSNWRNIFPSFRTPLHFSSPTLKDALATVVLPLSNIHVKENTKSSLKSSVSLTSSCLKNKMSLNSLFRQCGLQYF